MTRVKIKFPNEKPLFTATISVRVGDINYGGHVGNDSILSIAHEARMMMLASKGYTEMEAGGNSMIMADAMLAYKNEAFYGDTLRVDVYTEELTRRSFDLLYRITVERDGKILDIAHVKTGMACFDYSTRRIAAMTPELEEWLLGK